MLLGGHFRLTCDANGDPSPKITWKKDGLPLLQDSRVFIANDGRSLLVEG